MDINKKQIMNKLDSISDDDLKNIVKSIARCAGVSERRAEVAVSDISKLRNSLGSMSENDLNKALSMLDDKTVSDIKKQMNM